MTVVIRFPERRNHSTRYRLATPGEILELTTGPKRLGWTRYRVISADLDEIEIEPVHDDGPDNPQVDDQNATPPSQPCA